MSKSVIVPRPYQLAAVEAVANSTDRSVLCGMATGTGKTTVFSLLAQMYRYRCLFVAHRQELVHQMRDTLQRVTGEVVGVEMGTDRADSDRRTRFRPDHRPPRLVVGSVQSMCSYDRLSAYDPRSFDLVVIDEAHHALSRTHREVIDYFKDGNSSIRIAAFTATPRRHDGRPLSEVFDSVVFNYPMQQAIADGYLVPIVQKYVRVESVHWEPIRTEGSQDYTDTQLQERMQSEEQVRRLVDPFLSLIGERQAIAFCPGVESAERCSMAFNSHVRDGSHWLCGETPADERKRWVDAYKANEIRCMFNHSLFTEGFDAAMTSAVGILRPTKNRSLYEQMVGRATRPWPGVLEGLPDDAGARKRAIAGSPKPYALVVDLEGVTLSHNLCAVVDLLGGDRSPELRDYVKKCQREQGGGEVSEEALDVMEADLALEVEEAELEAARVFQGASVLKSKTRFSTASPDPFRESGESAPDPVARLSTMDKNPLCTQSQVNMLVKLGDPRRASSCLTKKAASARIDLLLKQKAEKGK